MKFLRFLITTTATMLLAATVAIAESEIITVNIIDDNTTSDPPKGPTRMLQELIQDVKSFVGSSSTTPRTLMLKGSISNDRNLKSQVDDDQQQQHRSLQSPTTSIEPERGDWGQYDVVNDSTIRFVLITKAGSGTFSLSKWNYGTNWNDQIQSTAVSLPSTCATPQGGGYCRVIIEVQMSQFKSLCSQRQINPIGWYRVHWSGDDGEFAQTTQEWAINFGGTNRFGPPSIVDQNGNWHHYGIHAGNNNNVMTVDLDYGFTGKIEVTKWNYGTNWNDLIMVQTGVSYPTATINMKTIWDAAVGRGLAGAGWYQVHIIWDDHMGRARIQEEFHIADDTPPPCMGKYCHPGGCSACQLCSSFSSGLQNSLTAC